MLQQSLRLDPKNIQAWLNKGISLDKLGKHDEALPCHNKASEIF